VDGTGKRPAARGRTGCLLPAIHRASGLNQSFFEDHSPTRRQSLDTGWRNYPRPELHAFIEKSHCAAASSRGGSCRRRTTDPQRLGRGATLPRCDVPQTPPIPQRTVALSPPVTHRFPRRGLKSATNNSIRANPANRTTSCSFLGHLSRFSHHSARACWEELMASPLSSLVTEMATSLQAVVQ
jgi:hypothetical protein